MWKNILLLICLNLLSYTHPLAQAKPCDDQKKIFKICADQNESFSIEFKKAQTEGKFLVVGFGADWCPWCISLHHLLDGKNKVDIGLYQDKDKVESGFMVLNKVKAMAGDPKLPAGIPLLAVINPKNNKAIFVNTEPLEKNTKTSKGHDPKKLAAAIKKAEKSLQ